MLTAEPPQDEALTDDALTGRMRVWQRARGHRYSLDDVLTAREALRAAPHARRALDLGCGIGSVLLMVLDGLLEAQALHATMVGVEAQAISFDLATRNVARNGVSDRVQLIHGDLRDPAIQAACGDGFDLVTGTPPYAPVGTATPSPDPQRAHARVEIRGGVEDYLAAAATRVGPEGRVVVCCDARRPERAIGGGRAAGLTPIRQLDAVPRAGRSPLFSVFTFAIASDAPFEMASPFIARDAAGGRTDEYRALRAFFGLGSGEMGS